jgi:hypothetical protein
MQCRISQKYTITEAPKKAAHWRRKLYFVLSNNLFKTRQKLYSPHQNICVDIHLLLSTAWLIIGLEAVMASYHNLAFSNFLHPDFYSILDNLINKNLAEV